MRTCLVVDDSRVIRKVARRIIEDMGFEVYEAGDGLEALACIITYTPGTVWARLSEGENLLTLHVLDLKDESHWIRTIKQRYEHPLMEIFE